MDKFVFTIEQGEDAMIYIAKRSYWDKYHCFDDSELHEKAVDDAVAAFDPAIEQESESVWYIHGADLFPPTLTTKVKAFRQHLLRAGFEDVSEKS